MTSPINSVFLRLPKRAESSGREELIQTFVDVGPLFALLSTVDHQILYGRRGTGKTHALMFLADDRESKGDLVAYVDLRNIGSSGGIYADTTRSIAERATCLLVDTLSAIHERLYDMVVARSGDIDLAQAGPALDQLAEAITQVRVVGSIEEVDASGVVTSEKESSSASLGAASGGIRAHVETGGERAEIASSARQRKSTGRSQLYVNFGSAGAAFRRLAALVPTGRVWLLLDEWSSLPLELQPYLADLLRRSVLPTSGMTVKIAAIEQRSTFQLRKEGGDYVGIEVGADASADVNLDDFMVFDNDPERAKVFFRDLITRHAAAVALESGIDLAAAKDPQRLLAEGFSQNRAFEEFVRASEGVPRDAINILALAATRALDVPISIEHVRVAAKNWYQRDKDTAVSANELAHRLLHWIIDKVIGGRRARAFLLQSDASDPLIDALYDARVLHVLKRNISTHDQPGVRYDAYKLDYGCYVDLVTTAKAPLGLFPADEGDGQQYVDVPPDDYRSIRRAILDLGELEGATKTLGDGLANSNG
ncbi:MAG TPA: hypothetical protein VL332_03925 [Candidatus Saccharimonadaceae bacterium]|jgi:hypothetical protein|nr:hypothetical protein [Candidatus Saccharimonadaceae bacterium]